MYCCWSRMRSTSSHATFAATDFKLSDIVHDPGLRGNWKNHWRVQSFSFVSPKNKCRQHLHGMRYKKRTPKLNFLPKPEIEWSEYEPKLSIASDSFGLTWEFSLHSCNSVGSADFGREKIKILFLLSSTELANRRLPFDTPFPFNPSEGKKFRPRLA